MRIRGIATAYEHPAGPTRTARRLRARATAARGRARILVVDDDPKIAAVLEKSLTLFGYQATLADDGESARSWLATSRFDLVLLDLRLPKVDGMTLLEELRRDDPNTPVIILTARDSVDAKVGGLQAGADDYITKPFRIDELMARIRARLREAERSDETALTVGPACLDLLGRRLMVAGSSVALTAREFSLAEIFFRNAGRVLSPQQLREQVWGYAQDPGPNAVATHVDHLRRKLRGLRITTVRGAGYRLEPNGDHA